MGDFLKKDEIYYLRRLAERFHTLPLSQDELSKLFNGSFQVGKVYLLLQKAERLGIFGSNYFNERKLIHLDVKKLKQK